LLVGVVLGVHSVVFGTQRLHRVIFNFFIEALQSANVKSEGVDAAVYAAVVFVVGGGWELLDDGEEVRVVFVGVHRGSMLMLMAQRRI
jgi:hypothetical protein